MDRRITTVGNWVKGHPLYALLSLVVVVVLVFAITGGVSGAISNWKSSRADARQAAHEKEVAGLKSERDAAIKKADIAEAKALLKEAEASELHDLINAKGGQIEKAANDLERKIEDAKRNAGNCADDPDPYGCTCRKLQSAGFACQ